MTIELRCRWFRARLTLSTPEAEPGDTPPPGVIDLATRRAAHHARVARLATARAIVAAQRAAVTVAAIEVAR